MILEIDAQGWVLILTAAGGFVTILGTAIAGVLIALKTGQKVSATADKVDQAATRREEIATTVLNPSMAVQAAPPVSPPVP